MNNDPITREGGIEAHVRNLGLDYDLLLRLDDLGVTNKRIGRELRPKRPLDQRTISTWRKRIKKEQDSAES